MTAPTVVILAAGQGTRMRSATPKLLHPICGWPMVRWPIEAARAAGAGKIVVVDGPENSLDGYLPDGVVRVVQAEPLGTADALRAATAELDANSPVIVLSGDVPLITSEVIAALAQAHEASGAAATMATIELDDPTGYGRVVRDADGRVARVAETKTAGDASAEELAIREVNTGVYAFDADSLRDALERVGADNAQGEYYLPDVLPVLSGGGKVVEAHAIHDTELMLGVNDRIDLATVRAHAQRRVHERHMLAGVTIVDPDFTVIDAGVELGQDTVIHPGSSLQGASRAGERCTIGPHTTLIDATLGSEVTVPHSYLVECEVHDRVKVGPFAYVRPGTVVHEGAKIGTFVEVKNSDIGAGAKVPHLSYIGDADVGEQSNLGAGTITANYDGERKHRTKIGKRVRGGVDTSFVAPVEVGDDAWTAAGSVVTGDVPPGALAVGRARQKNVKDYAVRKESGKPKADG